MTEFRIGHRLIGERHPTFIVAELGANHGGDKSKLLELVDAAAESGVDAIKLQIYSGADLVSDHDRVITHGIAGKEKREKIGALFDRLSVSWEWQQAAFDLAKKRGLIAFSTPFSVPTARRLGDLGVPAFKVAASDLLYLPMLAELARFNRPIIISAGKCTLGEVSESVQFLQREGADTICILHCVAQYPAPAAEMRLKTIPLLQQMFPTRVIGLSDHSIGIGASLGAVTLGARVVEKHFTLSKQLDGPDDWFSADPAEMTAMVREIRALEAGLVGVREGVLDCELHERKTSVRSLVALRKIKAGVPIGLDDLTMLRPGTGISPLDVEKVIGLVSPNDIEEGTVLTWSRFQTRPA